MGGGGSEGELGGKGWLDWGRGEVGGRMRWSG